MKRTIEERLLNPKPGSKIAAAKEFGIDLTLLLKNQKLTPQQRINQLNLFEQKVRKMLKLLIENEVEVIISGELACFAHGWKTITQLIEVCYLRTSENNKKIVDALAPFNPRLRVFSKDLPFIWNEQTLQYGTNFTLETDIGDIDLLGEVAGVGNFQDVLNSSEYKELFGMQIRVLNLDGLINAKRAAGRTKDLLVLPELEALRELLNDEDDE